MTDAPWIHITFAARPDCYNMMASCYGSCYGCGCCSKVKPDRYINRLRYLQEELEEEEHFDQWDDDAQLRAVQERNVQENIKFFRRRIRIYQSLLARYRKEHGDADDGCPNNPLKQHSGHEEEEN